MPITIKDLAKKLSLSITTVSRALDGYSDVSESTRLRVVQAAAEMGYEPSFAARQLRKKRTDAIGYILPTDVPRFSDPFYATFLTGLCDKSAQLGMDLMISAAMPGSEQEQRQYRHWALSARVDGMVLNRVRMDDWRINVLMEHAIPFVTLGESPSCPTCPRAEVDDTQAFQDLVNLLVSKGHRRIAYVGGPEYLVIQAARLYGYQKGLNQARIEVEEALMVNSDLTEEGGSRACLQLLRLPKPPTAIIGINDNTALGVLKTLQQNSIIPGDEIAVAGYDGIKETASSNPRLTTVSQPTYEIATRLVGLLVELIRNGRVAEPVIRFQPQLIIRESTG